MPPNTEDYEGIPPMRRVRDACVLRVYPDGLVALNGKLLERSNEKAAVGIAAAQNVEMSGDGKWPGLVKHRCFDVLLNGQQTQQNLK